MFDASVYKVSILYANAPVKTGWTVSNDIAAFFQSNSIV